MKGFVFTAKWISLAVAAFLLWAGSSTALELPSPIENQSTASVVFQPEGEANWDQRSQPETGPMLVYNITPLPPSPAISSTLEAPETFADSAADQISVREVTPVTRANSLPEYWIAFLMGTGFIAVAGFLKKRSKPPLPRPGTPAAKANVSFPYSLVDRARRW